MAAESAEKITENNLGRERMRIETVLTTWEEDQAAGGIRCGGGDAATTADGTPALLGFVRDGRSRKTGELPESPESCSTNRDPSPSLRMTEKNRDPSLSHPATA